MENSPQYWNNEYTAGPRFQALSSSEPSISALKLVNFFQTCDIPLAGTLLEVGCGLGRNTNYLAQRGFQVTGVDFSSVAITTAKQRADQLGLPVDYKTVDISQPWPLADGSRQVIFDSVTSHLLTRQQFACYTKEMTRVLQPQGFFIVYTLDRSRDKMAQKLLRDHPGPEPNTYLLPEMELIERTYTFEDLTRMFSPLKPIWAELISRQAKFNGLFYSRLYWWTVFWKGDC